MGEPTMENVMRRLERLERKNRRLTWLTAILLAGGITVAVIVTVPFVTKQIPPSNRIVEAEKVVVKDRHGNVRAILGESTTLEREAQYGLFLYGTKAVDRARLAVVGDGSELYLTDEKIGQEALLQTRGGHVTLSLNAYTQSKLERFDKTLKAFTGVSQGPGIMLQAMKGGPELILGAKEGTIRMTSVGFSPLVTISDRDNKVVWHVPK